MKRLLNIHVDPYELSVQIDPSDPNSVVKIFMVLPHELFATLWEHTDVAEQRMIGGECVRSFWQIASDCAEPFFKNHPMKAAILADMNSHIPIRVWGGDAPVGKHGRRSGRSPGHRLPRVRWRASNANK